MASSAGSHAGKEVPEGFFYTAGPALASGAAQAVLFNPIDRALYVRVRFRRKRFLDWRNFEHPFQGFMNAAVYRTLVGASYMFWQDSARIYIERFLPQVFHAETSPQLNSFVIGLFAGSVNGLALNTLQVVKFRMWNTDERGVTFARTARLMYQEAGLAIFLRGCMTTMVRDSVFGVIYETTRRSVTWRAFFDRNVSALMGYRWRGRQADGSDGDRASPLRRETTSGLGADPTALAPHESGALCVFVSNLFAAILASMLSSPFNYVRSIVYGTPPGAIPLGYWSLLKSFYTQFFFIWRLGRSYTDYHSIPQLIDIEHATASAKTSTLASSSGAAGAAKGGASAPGAQPGVRRTVEAALAGRVQAVSGGVRRWGEAHHQHPIAAWRWANSRLNIGWGSFRVGLGMAMSQSLFHLAQDLVRDRDFARAT